VGRNGVVDIATGCRLDGPGDLIPVGARFSTTVQIGPGVNPATCDWVTLLFPGSKAVGAWR
jgi:hypothetical protein